jgi:cell wall-associated NlpC family hydrolase
MKRSALCVIFLIILVLTTRLKPEQLQPGDKVVVLAAHATVYAQPKVFKGKIQYPLFSAAGAGNITHFLYGERLCVIEVSGDWARVQSLEQPVIVVGEKAADGIWKHCNGWVRATQLTKVAQHPLCSAVVRVPWALGYAAPNTETALTKFSLGSMLQVAPQKEHEIFLCVTLHTGSTVFVKKTDIALLDDLKEKTEPQWRSLVCNNALQLLGGPYCWGGCMANDPNNNHDITGADCSALIHLAYRSVGLVVARNSVSLHRQAVPVKLNTLACGDVVFQIFFNKGELRVHHVALYLGNDLFLSVVGRSKQTGVVLVASRDLIGCSMRSVDDFSYTYKQNGLDIVLTAGSLFGPSLHHNTITLLQGSL